MRTGTVLTRDQLSDIGRTILESSKSDICRVQIKDIAHSVTRVANNRIMSSDNGNRLYADIMLGFGGRVPVSMNTNHLDRDSIRAIVSRLDSLASVQVGSSRDYMNMPDGMFDYMPVGLWHDTTAQSIQGVGDTSIPLLTKKLGESGLWGSSFVGLMARSTFVLQRDGLTAFNEETDSECTVSVRTPDGKSSGWCGQARRDWYKVQPDYIADRAIEIAKRGMNPIGFEPGRRTAILSPYAVAQMMRYFSRQFDAYATNVQGATGFSILGNPNKCNKMGMRVLDARLRIVSDPADAEGGYVPFGDTTWDGAPLPTRKMTWVEQGVLKDLAYNSYYSLSEGKEFSQNPWSMRLEAEPEVHTLTIEEMIANCPLGIFVNRFSNVMELDSRTGLQTGVTRDGCFLVKDGKIDRAIKNFRFLDSPYFVLNQLEAIGKPERAAFGFTPAHFEPDYVGQWPRRPMIVPALMVRNFNFNSLSEAV